MCRNPWVRSPVSVSVGAHACNSSTREVKAEADIQGHLELHNEVEVNLYYMSSSPHNPLPERKKENLEGGSGMSKGWRLGVKERVGEGNKLPGQTLYLLCPSSLIHNPGFSKLSELIGKCSSCVHVRAWVGSVKERPGSPSK